MKLAALVAAAAMILAQQVPPVTAPANAPSAPSIPALDGAADDESIQEYVTDPLSDSVVRVHISRQEVDVDAPWRKKGVEIRQAAGVFVAGGRILVTAQAILDATFIEMSRVGESRRYELTPEAIDEEVNLAVLRPRDPLLPVRLVPLELSGLLPVRAEAEALSWQGGQLVRTKARIADIAMRKARTSAYDVASYLLDVTLQTAPASLPLVRHGRLAGLIDQSDDNGTFVIPASVVRHFLGEGAGAPYRGFAGLGLDTAPLVSPDARGFFKVSGVEGGIRVTGVAADGPCAEFLRPNDVLLKVAGHDLDDYGRYRHPFWGRVSFRYLLNEFYGGEKTNVTILRDGKPMTFTLSLTRFASGRNLARPSMAPGDPPYLLVGGLLLMPLDRVYLESWGPGWQGSAPVELVHAAHRQESTVVLSRVLADEINQGFEDLTGRIVGTINGARIRSLADANQALAKPTMRGGKAYAVIELDNDGGRVVLPYAGLATASARIAAKYGVRDSYFSPPSGF